MVLFGTAFCWAACHCNMACGPIDVGVMLLEPSVSQDHFGGAEGAHSEGGPLGVVLETHLEVRDFSDRPSLIACAIDVVYQDGLIQGLGLKALLGYKIFVNEDPSGSAIN